MTENMQDRTNPLGTQVPGGSFLEKFTNGLEKVVVPLNQFTHNISKIVLFLMMFLTFFDVLGRNFSKPITGTFELTGLGQVILVFLSLGITQIHKEHITIDILVEKLPNRLQHIVNALVHLIVSSMLFVTFFQLIVYTQRTMAGNEISVDLGLPMYWFTAVAAVGIFVFALSIILDFFKSLVKAVQKHES